MTAQELLAALSGAGASLSARDGKLKFDGPAELLQLHKEAIAALRPQLLELLAPPCCCETVGGWLYLRGCTLPEGLALPQTVGGWLYLWGCTLPEGLVLPQTVGGRIYR